MAHDVTTALRAEHRINLPIVIEIAACAALEALESNREKTP
jgi:hypothetical protein